MTVTVPRSRRLFIALPLAVGLTKVHPFNRKWGTLLRRDLWSREP